MIQKRPNFEQSVKIIISWTNHVRIVIEMDKFFYLLKPLSTHDIANMSNTKLSRPVEPSPRQRNN